MGTIEGDASFSNENGAETGRGQKNGVQQREISDGGAIWEVIQWKIIMHLEETSGGYQDQSESLVSIGAWLRRETNREPFRLTSWS
jgi:hypothetical protein